MRDLLTFVPPGPQPAQPGPLLRTMVGGVLRRTRLSQRRTLADVAAAARISMQYLSELERGRKEASSEILAALCGALHLDLYDLLAAVGHDLSDQRDGRARRRLISIGEELAAEPARPDEPASLLLSGEAAGADLSLAPDRPAAPRGHADPVCLLAA